MKQKLTILWGFLVMAASALLLTMTPAHAANNATINYSGTLVALPCTVPPGTEDIYVDMGVIPTKSLYRFKRTAPKLVSFELKDCDTDLGNTIAIYFSGPMTSDGLLAFSASSSAKGAGIGLESMSGTPININNIAPYKVNIVDGDMTVQMKAFVQGTQEALADKAIEPGFFNAVLTYIMSYE
ncbi:fimbrial protein [Klebsiella sp. BIGb0407]|uniref:fimbrial protein n=1 Tax=Klebsiella sp. BIGb0407 TaxID=2940603 RepID=UPI002168C066|nr:fimbrial protein [Klebsiella sp. BIGb0407]MCS3433872.1 type 1 fimbria pilin [Klebsiella sp. BIGb0407]